MHEKHEDTQALISGYLDGELDPETQDRVERLLETDPAFRKEFDRMKRLIEATSDMAVEAPPEEVWDTFLDDVYNRLERQTGWTVFIAGLTVLAALGTVWFVVADWAPMPIKVAVAAPAVGLTILFVSVLRQRLFVAKTDRYSREVKR